MLEKPAFFLADIIVCAGPSRSATALVFNMAEAVDSAADSIVVKRAWFRDRRFRAAVVHVLDMKALMKASGMSGFVQTTPVSPADTQMLARDARGRYQYDTTPRR